KRPGVGTICGRSGSGSATTSMSKYRAPGICARTNSARPSLFSFGRYLVASKTTTSGADSTAASQSVVTSGPIFPSASHTRGSLPGRVGKSIAGSASPPWFRRASRHRAGAVAWPPLPGSPRVRSLRAARDGGARRPAGAWREIARLYQQPAGLTGMRAGLVWRLRAKSMRYQRPDNRPMSQESGPLVLQGRMTRAGRSRPYGSPRLLRQRDDDPPVLLALVLDLHDP